FAGDVVADHPGAAARRIEDAAQHADGGRLAGPVGAEHTEDLTPRHRERDVVDRDQVAEAARQVLGDDDRGGRACRGRAARRVTNAGLPACRRRSGSARRTRTRTTRWPSSRWLKTNLGVNSTAWAMCSIAPVSATPSAVDPAAARPTRTPASSLSGTKMSTY